LAIILSQFHSSPISEVGKVHYKALNSAGYYIFGFFPLRELNYYKSVNDKSFKIKIKGNTHDMSINKLLQISISNYGLLPYFSPIRILNFYWVGELAWVTSDELFL